MKLLLTTRVDQIGKFFKVKHDYYSNPVVKILLPRMQYEPGERAEVIRQAYQGLFEMTTPLLFEKYLDFIDIYAEVQEAERDTLYNELVNREDTVMLAQYIKDKGRQEGRQQGRQEGRQEGILMGIEDLMEVKFGENGLKLIPEIAKISDIDRLREIRRVLKESQSLDEVEQAIFQ